MRKKEPKLRDSLRFFDYLAKTLGYSVKGTGWLAVAVACGYEPTATDNKKSPKTFLRNKFLYSDRNRLHLLNKLDVPR